MPSPSFFRPNKSSRPVLFLARSWGGPQRTNGKPRVFRSNTFLVSSILCSFCFRVFFHRGGGGVLSCFCFLRKKNDGLSSLWLVFLLCWEAKRSDISKRKTTNPHTHHHPENPKTRVEFGFCRCFFWRNQALQAPLQEDLTTTHLEIAGFPEKRGFFDRDFGGALRGEPTTLPENKKNDDCWEIRMSLHVFPCEKWGCSNLILVFRACKQFNLPIIDFAGWELAVAG